MALACAGISPEQLLGSEGQLVKATNKAEFNLGLAYLQGEGVKKSPMRARFWVRKAAENGNRRANRLLPNI